MSHNRRQELIDEHGYCECDWSSPSAHHDCCINDGCGKVIKTTSEIIAELRKEIIKLKADNEWQVERNKDNTVQYCNEIAELKEEIKFLKSVNERLEEARAAYFEDVIKLEKELELRTRWTCHHRNVSQMDCQKKREAERERDHYKNELVLAKAEIQRQKDMVESMMDINHRNCDLSLKNEFELREYISYLADELKKYRP